MLRQRRFGRMLLVVATVILGMIPSAWAYNDFPPPFGPNPGDGVTVQGWEFWGNPQGTTDPTHANNPFGPPVFDPRGAVPGFDPNGPGLTGVNTWHVLENGGGFDLSIPNDPREQPLKEIQLQFTSDQPALGPPTTSPGGTASPAGSVDHGPSQGGEWVNYNWILTIQPNPASETISVSFPAGTDIGEVDVLTICTTPEPATLSLLALGGLAAIRRRK